MGSITQTLIIRIVANPSIGGQTQSGEAAPPKVCVPFAMSTEPSITSTSPLAPFESPLQIAAFLQLVKKITKSIQHPTQALDVDFFKTRVEVRPESRTREQSLL